MPAMRWDSWSRSLPSAAARWTRRGLLALGLAGDDAFARLVEAIATNDAVGGLTLVANLASSGADLRRFVADGLDLFRGLFLTQYAPNLQEIVDESPERLGEWRELARKLQPSEVLRCIDRLAAALADLREGREERLVVESHRVADVPPGDLGGSRRAHRSARQGGGPVAALQVTGVPTVSAAPPVVAASTVSSEATPPTPPRSTPAAAAAKPRTTAKAEAPFESVTSPVLVQVSSTLAPITGLTLDVVETAWPEVVAKIRDEVGPRRFALFREVRPAEVTDSTVVLEIPASLPFHLARLGEDDALNATAVRVLGEVLGGGVRLAYRSGAAHDATAINPEPHRAPHRDTLTGEGEGAIDPAALMAHLLDGEVVE